jgi:hypothetical protein
LNRIVVRAAAVATFAIAVISFGCNSGESAKSDSATAAMNQPSPTGVETNAGSVTGAIAMVKDPAIRGAKIEIKTGKAFVHISPNLERMLSDTLPGFVPFPISAYDSTVWASEVERDSTAVLPSVVIDDFDGDGQPDVAMVGVSRDSAAEVLLLTNANSRTGPRLLFMSRPQAANGSNKTEILLRRIAKETMADQYKVRVAGVEEEYIGKGAVVFYIERGALQQVQTGDD